MTKARTNADNASADIQGVTAGTGLSGGGTSGTVTLTNDMATTIDAKGDLVVGTGADTYSRLATGNNGETLVADSSATTGLRWQGNFAAGKNKIINGDFGIWQRGTSITPSGSGYFYGADRWQSYSYGASTTTMSRQSFTAGTAPVAGYESSFFARLNSTSGNTVWAQRIEDVRTFANQTITISFWSKAASNATGGVVQILQNFGSGGSAEVATSVTNSLATSTSWTRYSYTVALPSISGKTVGTSSYIELNIFLGAINNNFDLWGVQIEAGNTATAFQTATGTLAGELCAAQRYYYRSVTGASNTGHTAVGVLNSTTAGRFIYPLPVQMRIAPTSVDISAQAAFDPIANTTHALTSPTLDANICSPNVAYFTGTVATATSGRTVFIISTSSSGFLGFSAEL